MPPNLYLSPALRIHDNVDADSTLDPETYFDRMDTQMASETVSDLKLFIIEQNDMVVAAGSWWLDARQKQWDWVQAFQIQDQKIVRTWLPAIGGNDESLSHGPKTAWPLDAMPQTSTRLGPAARSLE